MKKKLLALAVAGAFVAPAAMADTANVNVYGVMNMSFDGTSTGNAAGGTSYSQTKVSSAQSRIGFKGAEDLGGGTSALFQIEQGLNGDASAGTTMGTRNTFVGLKGDSWGTVLLGVNDTPYKSSTRGMDLFFDTIADNRTLMGGITGVTSAIAFDGRSSNSVTYNSPDLSGFKVGVQYVAGAETATTAASAATKGNMWSLAGSYAAGPITAALAYETHDMGSPGSGALAGAAAAPSITGVANKKERAYKLAGGYALDQFAVNVVYEKTSDGFGAGGVDLFDHRTWYLAGKYNVTGSDAVKVAYTNMGHVGSVNNSGAKQMSIGYDHSMSKRTTVYALYTKLTNDSAANYSLANGVSTGGSAAGGAGAGLDADPSAFSVGLRHAF
ncbi:MAG: porin [Nitrosomonadales bacterium]|nr:porin [Nitrosomonadales bacterium]